MDIGEEAETFALVVHYWEYRKRSKLDFFKVHISS